MYSRSTSLASLALIVVSTVSTSISWGANDPSLEALQSYRYNLASSLTQATQSLVECRVDLEKIVSWAQDNQGQVFANFSVPGVNEEIPAFYKITAELASTVEKSKTDWAALSASLTTQPLLNRIETHRNALETKLEETLANLENCKTGLQGLQQWTEMPNPIRILLSTFASLNDRTLVLRGIVLDLRSTLELSSQDWIEISKDMGLPAPKLTATPWTQVAIPSYQYERVSSFKSIFSDPKRNPSTGVVYGGPVRARTFWDRLKGRTLGTGDEMLQTYEGAYNYCLNLNPENFRSEIQTHLSKSARPARGSYLCNSQDYKDLRDSMGADPDMPITSRARGYITGILGHYGTQGNGFLFVLSGEPRTVKSWSNSNKFSVDDAVGVFFRDEGSIIGGNPAESLAFQCCAVGDPF